MAPRAVGGSDRPVAGLGGSLQSEIALLKHFEELARLVTQDAVAKRVVCGPDPEKVVQQVLPAPG